MEAPNRDSCDCYPVDSFQAVMDGRIGAFFIADDGKAIAMKLPDGGYCRLPLDGSRGWQWNGNREKPTITPSILSFVPEDDGTRTELWHGFMRAGRLESC